MKTNNILEALKVLDKEISLSAVKYYLTSVTTSIPVKIADSMVNVDKLVSPSKRSELLNFLENVKVKFNVSDVKLRETAKDLFITLRADFIIGRKVINLPIEKMICFLDDEIKVIEICNDVLLDLVANRFGELYMDLIHYNTTGIKDYVQNALLSEFNKKEVSEDEFEHVVVPASSNASAYEILKDILGGIEKICEEGNGEFTFEVTAKNNATVSGTIKIKLGE